MASSLQHVSEKMMKMDIDKLGAQSLGLSLIPAVPDKFLIKYNPPKICVVYHFKDHNANDQYWRDIPLDVADDSTASSLTDTLFKEHSYYFDKDLITSEQVEKLLQMVIDKNSGNRRKEDTSKREQEEAHNQPSKDKSKVHSKLFKDIERARNMDEEKGSAPPAAGKKNILEPLKNDPKKKLEPLEPKKEEPKKEEPKKDIAEDFDFLELDDAKEEEPKEKKQESAIEDDYDFDFDFESPKPTEGSKVSSSGNKESKEKEAEKPKVEVKPASEAKPANQDKGEANTRKEHTEIDVTHPDAKEGKNEDEEEEYTYIDGKRFREIQIEGEKDEFLMDDDGNIYDMQGVYIGTAKDGGEEEEEEDEK